MDWLYPLTLLWILARGQPIVLALFSYADEDVAHNPRATQANPLPDL